jgi:hypothetical protein
MSYELIIAIFGTTYAATFLGLVALGFGPLGVAGGKHLTTGSDDSRQVMLIQLRFCRRLYSIRRLWRCRPRWRLVCHYDRLGNDGRSPYGRRHRCQRACWLGSVVQALNMDTVPVQRSVHTRLRHICGARRMTGGRGRGFCLLVQEMEVVQEGLS